MMNMHRLLGIVSMLGGFASPANATIFIVNCHVVNKQPAAYVNLVYGKVFGKNCRIQIDFLASQSLPEMTLFHFFQNRSTDREDQWLASCNSVAPEKITYKNSSRDDSLIDVVGFNCSLD